MITQYYRPQTLEEALKLLSQPDTRPLGGGTALTQKNDESFSVVDLQALGLNKIHK
jgi:CO/xanthine dehydrogenase FAD-binding subunit